MQLLVIINTKAATVTITIIVNIRRITTTCARIVLTFVGAVAVEDGVVNIVVTSTWIPPTPSTDIINVSCAAATTATFTSIDDDETRCTI